MNEPLRLNPQIVRQGLGWAQSWTDGPILCVITPESVGFAVVNEQRFVAGWEWAEDTGAPYRFFLIPPFIASTLSGHKAYEFTGLRVRTNRNYVAVTVRDAHGEYVLQWRWQAASFPAPVFFEQMVQVPEETVERRTFVAIADAVHLAIANLGRLEAIEEFDRRQLAIVIDFAPGHFKIDGQPITLGDEQRYYFDPRLIMRGLEIVRGRHIGFSVASTTVPGQSILYMTSERDNWRLYCSMLSIIPDETTHIISQRVRTIRRSVW